MQKGRTEDTQLNYTIYYRLLEALSGRGDADALHVATIVVLAGSYGLRVAVTWFIMSLAGLGVGLRVVGTLATSIAAPLTRDPLGYMHVGKLSPVIWHNSTTILAAPFALLLFASTCWVILRKDFTWAPQVVQLALVVVSGWTKPNYLLTLIPALVVVCVVDVATTATGLRLQSAKSLWWRAAPSGAAASVVLVSQFLLTYGGEGIQVNGQSVGNVVAPFAVWSEWKTQAGVQPLISVYLSLAPSFIASILIWRNSSLRLPLGLAWTSVIVGLVEFTILAEVLDDGTVLPHGNWVWGGQLSMAVLFVVSVTAALRDFRTLGRIKWFFVAVLTYQVAMGITWMVMLLSGRA
ncbi:hypothetical protein [Ornithinimicrobium sp. W1665]|uniref:hypothetical protein n=1 Tax=Ornithinimicrobium sp. W1665 TaxID=3416666 RepID=UPI003CEFACB2